MRKELYSKGHRVGGRNLGSGRPVAARVNNRLGRTKKAVIEGLSLSGVADDSSQDRGGNTL